MMTQVGPGTPMGEFHRRYWHPIAEHFIRSFDKASPQNTRQIEPAKLRLR